MFKPYKKAAKLSLKRAKLSCITCRCMKFASRSTILSESSAKAGSKASNGDASFAPAESRKLVLETGRSGVVGRAGDLRPRLVDRLRGPRWTGGSAVGVVDAMFPDQWR